jgi:hypothetical protein
MKIYKKYLGLLVIGLLVNGLSAQIDSDPDAGTSVPIDGGIVTVTLIAAAYGAKRKSKQKEESNDDI